MLAWAVTELGAAAGVMVTASHNPPADNGYKVYLGDGAQIVPPHDAEIAARIDAVDPTAVRWPTADDPLIERLGADRASTATSTRCAAVRLRPAATGVPVAYTPMHGVGGELVLRAFERRRAAGAVRRSTSSSSPTRRSRRSPSRTRRSRARWTCVIALAADQGALLALANDPDADRLGAAIPQPDGSWRRLGGDEIGWLLADHLLTHTTRRRPPRRDDARVVVAARHDGRATTACTSPETFTGFKWMARAVLDHPELRFVFGYEQALGYLVDVAAARQGRHLGGRAARRGRRRRRRARARRCRLASTTIAARYGRHVVGRAGAAR